MIELDYKKDPELFNKTAEKWAKEIGKDVKNTQIRKFYDKVLELYERSQKEDFSEILPFVKMLNSKVAYAKTRGVCGNNFEILMKESINKVSTPEELQNFKYFLESIIGFMPKK